MITPEKVQAEARKTEDENYRFRRYLKSHAVEDRLDGQLYKLHRELFSTYDCSKCRNCCRVFRTTIQQGEIKPIADTLSLDKQVFIRQYLTEEANSYQLPSPCPFLTQEGGCKVEACKPEECRDFPYTDKPGRLRNLLSLVSFAEVCPVVYEMLERLKDMYHFKR